MINYRNGKTLLTLSFLAKLLLSIANPVFVFISGILDDRYIWEAGNFLTSIAGSIVSLAMIAAFFIMWLSEKQFLDLFATGILGLSFLFSFFSASPPLGELINLIAGFIGCLIYVVLAIKVKYTNRFVSLLLYGASLCSAFSSIYFLLFNYLVVRNDIDIQLLALVNIFVAAMSFCCMALGLIASRMRWNNE